MDVRDATLDASPWVPRGAALGDLRRDACACRGCDLWRDATQTVFGEGPPDASLMLIGEQPGDREDREGSPFVGPAGRMLDLALEAVGLRRDEIYVTNAVKHFRHEERGKKRIHRKPTLAHLRACEPWVREEISAVRPAVLGLLGATAARAILGRDVRIGEHRGAVEPTAFGPPAVITAHPSSIVRERDAERREEAFAALVADLQVAAITAQRA
jgi:uracil-DNA glycosylase family protein